jgi:hypothetical protein
MGLDQSRPAAVVEFDELHIAMSFTICFPGFKPHQPVQAEVRLPDGSSRRMKVQDYSIDEGVPNWYWHSLPGDPVGVYEVSASQASLRGTGSFTVARASIPYLNVAPRNDGPPGTTFSLAMAGFTPNAEETLYLYHQSYDDNDSVYRYLTSLTLRMDGNGELLYFIPTSSDDRHGAYCFVDRGPKAAPEYACGRNEFVIV